MLVIEGADNLGKTTAAKRIVELAKVYGLLVEYGHMGRPAEDFDFLHGYKPMLKPNVVQDRFHIGGRVWHGMDKMCDDKMQVISSWVRSLGGLVVVFCSFDDEWYHKRLIESDRKEMFSVAKIEQANRFYRMIGADRTVVDAMITVGPNGFVPDSSLKTLIQWWQVRKQFSY